MAEKFNPKTVGSLCMPCTWLSHEAWGKLSFQTTIKRPVTVSDQSRQISLRQERSPIRPSSLKTKVQKVAAAHLARAPIVNPRF